MYGILNLGRYSLFLPESPGAIYASCWAPFRTKSLQFFFFVCRILKSPNEILSHHVRNGKAMVQ